MFRIYLKVEHQGGCQLNFAAKTNKWMQSENLATFLNGSCNQLKFSSFCSKKPSYQISDRSSHTLKPRRRQKISAELPNKSQLLF